MRCYQAQKLIPLFANNELQDSQRRKVDEHLRRCAACKKATGEYAALSRLAKKSSPLAEPEGFYDDFFAEVMARTAPAVQQKIKPATKKFALPALRPRFAFAGIAALIAIIAFGMLIIKVNEPDRTTLEEYLLHRDFPALARAIADDRQRSKLVSDSVSVDLFIESLRVMDKMNTGYGQVAQIMAPVVAVLQQEASKRLEYSADNPGARAAPQVIQAGMPGGRFDFKKTIRALRLIDRPGVKVTLIDLAKYRHRQAQL